MTGALRVFFEPVPGGHGGRPHEDGVSATVCFHEGDTPDVPVEVQKSTIPILVEESAAQRGGACRRGTPSRRTRLQANISAAL